jgi:hypothetical protein
VEPKVLHAESEHGYAVARFDGRLQSIALYDIGNDETALPVEVRAWRATQSIAPRELRHLLDEWCGSHPRNVEYGISTEDLRSIPVASLHRHIEAQIRSQTRDVSVALRVPSAEEIEMIISGELVPNHWRNSRDFRAQARQLRGVIAYLEAVYTREDVEPMKAVSAATGANVVASRKLIEQARERGFLTRTNGHIGGRLTERGIEAAALMNEALAASRRKK